MTFKFRDVRKSLKKKGFVEKIDGHHKYLHFQYDGKDVGPYTYTSHGKDSDEVGSSLVSQMKNQLRLESNQQVNQLVECTLSEDGYKKILQKQGLLPTKAK